MGHKQSFDLAVPVCIAVLFLYFTLEEEKRTIHKKRSRFLSRIDELYSLNLGMGLADNFLLWKEMIDSMLGIQPHYNLIVDLLIILKKEVSNYPAGWSFVYDMYLIENKVLLFRICKSKIALTFFH